MKFAWLPCNYLGRVWDQLWALNMTWHWPYAGRSSSICAKRFTDMPWSTWNRLVQKKVGGKVISLRTRLCEVTEIYGREPRDCRCWLGGQLLFFIVYWTSDEREWKGRLTSEPVGGWLKVHLTHLDISPLDGEIHVFPTPRTFLWRLAKSSRRIFLF